MRWPGFLLGLLAALILGLGLARVLPQPEAQPVLPVAAGIPV